MTSTGRRIVVATSEPVTARMAGPAIRAWHMADVLSVEHEVVLVSTEPCDRSHPRCDVRTVTSADLRELERWYDVLVAQTGFLTTHPFLRASDKVIVGDIYDPFHLENLESSGRPSDEQAARFRHLVSVVNEQLRRGDFFVCASGRQRDFWLGSLAALGRVNPVTYEQSVRLESLVSVVPFGLPAEPPRKSRLVLRDVVPGIGKDDKVLLWAGGVYNWFDPITLVRAVDVLRKRVPNVRLFFLGLGHPNPKIPPMQTVHDLRALAGSLGLAGTHVFFNEGWVEYDDRAEYLLEADIGVSTHLDSIETAYSFRTRVLDYLWARLPIVATGGDAFSDMIRDEGLGATVPPGDVQKLEEALFHLLDDREAARACRANAERVVRRFRWDRVMAPLMAFCRSPARAPDLLRAEAERSEAEAASNGGRPAPSRDDALPPVLRRAGGHLRRLLGR